MTGHGAGLDGAIVNITASGAPFNFGADKFLMLRIDLNKAVSNSLSSKAHVQDGPRPAWGVVLSNMAPGLF